MKNSAKIMLIIFLALIPMQTYAQENFIEPRKIKWPEASVTANEVYGRIEYSVSLTQNRADATRSFQNFLRIAVNRIFGSEEGNYVVTLVVKNGSVEVAKKAIFSFTWRKRNILFFEAESDITSDISFAGRLLDHFPVSNNNNQLQVALQLQNTTKVALDTETYNKFSDQVSLLKFDAVQPAVELTSALKPPLELMKLLLDSSTKKQLSADTAMSFIKNGSGFPKWIEFKLKDPGMRNGLIVTLKLETDRSLLAAFENGRFQNLDLNSVLSKATIGVSGAGIPFEDGLGNDANKQLRDYLSALDRGEFPTGKQPAAVCRKLWDTLQRFFTMRDAPAIYAAYLDKYDYVLNVPGAKSGCVEQFRSTIEGYGIRLTGVAINQ